VQGDWKRSVLPTAALLLPSQWQHIQHSRCHSCGRNSVHATPTQAEHRTHSKYTFKQNTASTREAKRRFGYIYIKSLMGCQCCSNFIKETG